MFYLDGDNVVFFDVDNTLIMWDPDPNDPRVINIPTLKPAKDENGDYTGLYETRQVIPHERHLTMIKSHKQLGNTVVVWSKSGPRWARNVVEYFGLTDYVDLICGKPSCFYDDLKPEEFMVERRYFTNDN